MTAFATLSFLAGAAFGAGPVPRGLPPAPPPPEAPAADPAAGDPTAEEAVDCASVGSPAAHREAGRHVQAEAVARSCLRLDPDHRDHGFELARALAAQERWPESLEVLDALLDRRPEDGEVALYRARVLAWMGDLEASEAAIAALPPAAVEGADGRSAAADTAFYRQKWEEAERRYAALLRDDPDDGRARKNRAVSLHNLGRDLEALEELDRAAVALPDDEQIPALEREILLKGNLCPVAKEEAADGRLEEAESLARACVRHEPELPAHWLALADVLVARGRADRARGWVERAVSKAPEDLDLRLKLVRVTAWGGDLASAWVLLERLPPEARESPEVLKLMAEVMFWRKRWDEAAERYTIYLETAPQDFGAVRSRAIARMKAGDRAGAVADWDLACTLAPDDPSTCGELREGADEEPYTLVVVPSWTYIDVLPDWFDLSATFVSKVREDLSIAFQVNYLRRAYVLPTVREGSDVLFGLSGDWKASADWTWSAGFGVAPRAEFAAPFNGWIEPTLALSKSVSVQLKYWFLHFDTADAHVLKPGLLWNPAPWSFTLQYYLGLSATEDVSHSAWFKVGRSLGAKWGLSAGAGIGDRTDYVLAEDLASDFSWMLLAGITYALDPGESLGLTYVFHEEREDVRILQRHQLLLAYSTTF